MKLINFSLFLDFEPTLKFGCCLGNVTCCLAFGIYYKIYLKKS